MVLYLHLLELEAAAAGLFDTAEIGEFRKRETGRGDRRQKYDALTWKRSSCPRRRFDSVTMTIPEFSASRVMPISMELVLPSEAAAAEIRERIVAGEEFSELADQSLRSDALRNNARFHFHRQDKQVIPKLMAAIDAASEGVLTGPVAVKGGYSVFRLLERVPAGTTPYAETRHRARALALRQRQAQAFHELLLRLRDKYGTQVVVHSEELTAGLPDSILQRQRNVSRTHVIQ